MKKYKFLIALLLVSSLLIFTLSGCMPSLATDKSIDGIVADGINHTDYPDFKGYIYGNKEEKYNINFRLRMPDNYDENLEYPLVVYLHWQGAQGVDNESQMLDLGSLLDNIVPQMQANNSDGFVLMPQLMSEKMSFGKFYNSIDCSSIYNACLDAILNNYSIDTKRVYITGVSMGSQGVWNELANYPDKYAAGMPVSLGVDKSVAEKVKNIPILAAHCKDDSLASYADHYAVYQAVKNAGGTKIDFNTYETGGHGAHWQFYTQDDTWKWLFSQQQ